MDEALLPTLSTGAWDTGITSETGFKTALTDVFKENMCILKAI